MLASTDCFIATRVEQAYAQLLAPGGQFSAALTIALTLYVVIYGYRLVLGRSALTLGNLVPHFIKIGVVLALVTSWPSYQRLVFDLIFAGPQQIAGAVMAQSDGSPTNVVTSLQAQFDRITDYAGDAWAQRPVNGDASPRVPLAAAGPQIDPTTNLPIVQPSPVVASNVIAGPSALGPPQFVGIAMWVSALLMLAFSIGLLLIARVILALLLMFGPVFLAMALFPSTRGLTEGWLRVTVKFGLVPLIVLPLSAVLLSVLGRFLTDLEPGPILAFRDTPALAILIITIVFAIVLSQALSLTEAIAQGIRLPRAAEPHGEDAESAVPAPVPMAQPNRTEAIANPIPGTAVSGSGTMAQDAVIANSRRIDVGSGPPPEPADYLGRLGQTERRLPPRTGFAADLRNATS